jgi:hypothetical protein
LTEGPIPLLERGRGICGIDILGHFSTIDVFYNGKIANLIFRVAK